MKIKDEFISKDKIKAKIESYKHRRDVCRTTSPSRIVWDGKIKALQELLESEE